MKQFLIDNGPEISEAALFRHFFPACAVRTDSMEFFTRHFHLYRQLYILADELANTQIETPYHLHIRLATVYLRRRPGPNECSWFDEDACEFCRHPVQSGLEFCPNHTELDARRRRDGTAGFSSMRSYYLNRENLEKMTEADLHSMNRGIYHYIGSIEDIERSLEIMGVGHDVTPERLKARFRFLAKHRHPDLTGNDRSEESDGPARHDGPDRHGEVDFSTVRDAYEILRRWLETAEE